MDKNAKLLAYCQLNHMERYHDGVSEGVTRNYIEMQRMRIADHFDHEFRGMTACNSRFLSPLARLAMGTLGDVRRILELGPGTGVAAAQMKHLVPEAEITTAWGALVNPYLLFKPGLFDSPSDDPHASLFEVLRMRHPGLVKPLDETLDFGPEHGSIEMDALLELEVFDRLSFDQPFIAKQIVGGCFDRELPWPEGPFDFIYERVGPLFYTDEFQRKYLFERIFKMLDPQGIMVIDGRPIDWPRLTDGLAMFTTRQHGSVVLRQDSPYANEIRAFCADRA